MRGPSEISFHGAQNPWQRPWLVTGINEHKHKHVRREMEEERSSVCHGVPQQPKPIAA